MDRRSFCQIVTSSLIAGAGCTRRPAESPRDGLARILGLSPAEREAIIEHELGHIRYFDLALLLPLELLCDLFWFVPGVKWLLVKQRALLEQRADECAVAAGIARESVASALLSAAELATVVGPVPVLATSRGPSTLRVRIQRLLAPEPVRVVAPWLTVVRGLVLIWVVLGTLQASACGNHP